MVEVAYGVPARSVSDAELLEALAEVSRNFDEVPKQMHAVLGPPQLGVRWFTFACSTFHVGHALAQDHFTETLEPLLRELIVVTRRDGSAPLTFSAGGLRLYRTGETIAVASGTLPAGARRDGDVDEIGLGALGLPIVRPFAVLEQPTHEVVLRVMQERPARLEFASLGRPALPVRVNPRPGHAGPDAERFPRVQRVVDGANLAGHVDAVLRRVGGEYVGKFEATHLQSARELANPGAPIAPLLVVALQGKPRPQAAHVLLTALGVLGQGAEHLVPWASKKSPLLRLAAHCALVNQAEAARPALVAARASRKAAERELGEALLAILDDPAFAPIRAARAARDALPDETRRAIDESRRTAGMHEQPIDVARDDPAAFAYFLRATAEGGQTAYRIHSGLKTLRTDATWSLGLFLLDTPVSPQVHYANDAKRDTILRQAVACMGSGLRPVAELLLRFPPFTADPVLTAISSA